MSIDLIDRPAPNFAAAEAAFRAVACRLIGATTAAVRRQMRDREIVVTPYDGNYGRAGIVIAVNGSPPRGAVVVSKGALEAQRATDEGTIRRDRACRAPQPTGAPPRVRRRLGLCSMPASAGDGRKGYVVMEESGGMLPVLPGSLQRVGNATYYHYRDAAGRPHKQHIRLADVERARAEIAAYRRQHPPVWSERQALAELRRRLEEGLV